MALSGLDDSISHRASKRPAQYKGTSTSKSPLTWWSASLALMALEKKSVAALRYALASEYCGW